MIGKGRVRVLNKRAKGGRIVCRDPNDYKAQPAGNVDLRIDCVVISKA